MCSSDLITMDKSLSLGALVFSAASLFIAGAVSADDSGGNFLRAKCFGVNACKGQSECKTAASSCKGLNACKGQGFLGLTEAECSSAGGKNGGAINS